MNAARGASVYKQFLVLVAPVLLFSIPTSRFNSNAEDWHVVTYQGDWEDYTQSPTDYGVAAWLPFAGTPGGCAQAVDPDQGDTFLQAPAKFAGNWAGAYGGCLQYDLQDLSGNGYNNAATVVLKGG